MNPRTLRIRRLLPQSCGGADRSSWSALLSEKYEKASSEAAATPNARLPNSAALPPTDQDSVAARPHKNPIGRQTQAIRRVRASTAEARSGLCFDLHHIGYRIPMPMPNDATAKQHPQRRKSNGNKDRWQWKKRENRQAQPCVQAPPLPFVIFPALLPRPHRRISLVPLRSSRSLAS